MKSMTGYGEAVSRIDRQTTIKAEIRSVNHRFFNLKISLPETLNIYESQIEELVRKYIRRGSINLVIKIVSPYSARLAIQKDLLKSYYEQLKNIQKILRLKKDDISIETLLTLPGVLGVNGERNEKDSLHRWLVIEKTVKSLLSKLIAMRQREGGRLKKGLDGILAKMHKLLSNIRRRAPLVKSHYEQSLTDKVSRLLSSAQYNDIKPSIINEFVIFAQRSDITEEIHRLESHLTEFKNTINQNGEAGKKLDFVTQEMLREANTIGTKANDADITYNIIALKSEIEKLKEQVQNIE